jgi:hypothetical protein
MQHGLFPAVLPHGQAWVLAEPRDPLQGVVSGPEDLSPTPRKASPSFGSKSRQKAQSPAQEVVPLLSPAARARSRLRFEAQLRGHFPGPTIQLAPSVGPEHLGALDCPLVLTPLDAIDFGSPWVVGWIKIITRQGIPFHPEGSVIGEYPCALFDRGLLVRRTPACDEVRNRMSHPGLHRFVDPIGLARRPTRYARSKQHANDASNSLNPPWDDLSKSYADHHGQVENADVS